MERDEHSLKRTCEDLRHTLDTRTRELSQSQELYSKLKQRVLLNQTQDMAPGVSRSRTPVQGGGTFDASRGHTQSQLPRPVMPQGARVAATSYFPASPGYSKSKPGSATLVEWNQPALSQRRCCSSIQLETSALMWREQVYPLRHPITCLSEILARWPSHQLLGLELGQRRPSQAQDDSIRRRVILRSMLPAT